jgi:hypothetical protein
MTRFGIVWPTCSTFRLDEVPTAARPVGNTCTKPTPDASVMVTFNTTADTPVAGTPPAPAARNVTTAPGPGLPADTPTPERVSTIRLGVTGWNFDGPDSAAPTRTGLDPDWFIALPAACATFGVTATINTAVAASSARRLIANPP